MTKGSFFTAPDGARLFFQDEGAGLPVIGLPGLTRSHTEFDFVAPHLSNVRLIRPDYRGRGASDWTGADSYTVLQEARDVLALMDHLGLSRAAILGTSRGGLIGMALGAMAKDRLLGVCLNDIGPVIERAGLERIFDYVGRNPAARTLDRLVERLPVTMAGFADVPAARWRAFAERLYAEGAKGLEIRYDPALREAFLKAFEAPAVDPWPFFDALSGLPVAVIRGAASDLLSRETVAEMARRHPGLVVAEVPNRAHVPFLDEPEALAAIRDWLALVRAFEAGPA
jgi:pimeloyl-ACP methyl ester carboxylesterase